MDKRQSALRKFHGFSAVRLPDLKRKDFETCGRHNVSFTLAKINTDKILDTATGVFTVVNPGIYFLIFNGVSSYSSEQTGVSIVLNSGTSLNTIHSQKGFTPMTATTTVSLKKNDRISISFWNETPNKGCLYHGNNENAVITSFSGFLLEPATN